MDDPIRKISKFILKVIFVLFNAFNIHENDR